MNSPTLPLYLDYHATTPVDPRVVEAMLPWFTERFGNAGSINHPWGYEAAEAVARARSTIAAALGATAREVIFTSGATESNNLAILGLARRTPAQRRHVVLPRTEHPSVLDPVRFLQRQGWRVSWVSVRQHGSPEAGLVDLDHLEQCLREHPTALVCVMLANNEIGVIQPLPQIVQLAHRYGAVVHCDATQALGRVPVNASELGVDLLSFSAHKFYGPKGVGGLYLRRRDPPLRLEPLLFGGGHENRLRSGTLNVPGIVGMARALELAVAELPEESQRLAELRDLLFSELQQRLGAAVVLHGPALDRRRLRLANNLNCGFPDVDGDALLAGLASQVAVSSGSACSTAEPEPSHVLRALGLPERQVRASLRFGLGRFTTREHIHRAAEAVAGLVKKLAG